LGCITLTRTWKYVQDLYIKSTMLLQNSFQTILRFWAAKYYL
jgi:hypothetical protein